LRSGGGGGGGHGALDQSSRRAIEILQRGLLGPDLARAAAARMSTADGALGEHRAGLKGLQPASQPIFRRGEVAPMAKGVRGGALVQSASGRGGRGAVASDSLTTSLQLVVLEQSSQAKAAPPQTA
jgi:hypothetical protein